MKNAKTTILLIAAGCAAVLFAINAAISEDIGIFALKHYSYDVPYRVVFLSTLIAFAVWDVNVRRPLNFKPAREIFFGLLYGYVASLVGVVVSSAFFYRTGEYVLGLSTIAKAFSEAFSQTLVGILLTSFILLGWLYGMLLQLMLSYVVQTYFKRA